MHNHDTVSGILGRPGYWQTRAEQAEQDVAALRTMLDKLRAELQDIQNGPTYAYGWNEGFNAAVAQELQDHPKAWVTALRAAADAIEQEADR